MRGIVVLFSSVLFAQAPAIVPAKVLPPLEARCVAAKQYMFEGTLSLIAQQGNRPARAISQANIKFALAPQGKYLLRITPADKDEYTLVSNGKKTWAYVPKLKQYMEQDGATVDVDDDDSDNSSAGDDERDQAEVWARQVIPILSRVVKTASGSDVNGSMIVKYHGKKAEWPTMRVSAKPEPDGTKALTELNMDPETGDLGRMVYSMAFYRGTEKTVLRFSMEFNHFQVEGDIPEDTFNFEPPRKAKLVESLPIPGQTGSFLQNKPAPDFEMKTLDGEKVRLSDLKGKPVVLTFWASWCGPCRKELPTLNKLNKEFQEKGLVILGVNDEGKSIGRQYAEEARLNFPTLDDSALKAHRLYRVRNIPSLFLIDKDGKVVRYFRGAHEESDLRAALKSVGF